MERYYPPVGFFFNVEFQFKNTKDQTLANATTKSIDICFQSVSGLNYQLQTETLKEGGENRFEHNMPVRSKCSDLVLRRGIVQKKDSVITKWCLDAFQNFIFSPISILITLQNEKNQPLMCWKVYHAWPKNWKIADLNADKGEIVIETFEINYNYFTFDEK